MLEANGKPAEVKQPDTKPSVTIVYDPETNAFAWEIKGQIPLPLLNNTLDLIKAQVLSQQMQVMAQTRAKMDAMRPKIVVPGNVRLN